MTVATIIVVVKFSVYITITQLKKLMIRQYIFASEQSPEMYLPGRIVVNYAIFKKIFSTDLYSKCSRLHKTTAKTSKI
jgi:hypothetical protein